MPLDATNSAPATFIMLEMNTMLMSRRGPGPSTNEMPSVKPRPTLLVLTLVY